jgi:multisubunit Na+/H+ antiporter MnhG subunit
LSLNDVTVAVLLFAGVALQAVSVVGLVAMRDTYDRLHYVGPAPFGAALIAIALFVRYSFSLLGNKALVTAAFLLVTSPVLVHVTARMCRVRDHGSWEIQRGERIEVEER